MVGSLGAINTPVITRSISVSDLRVNELPEKIVSIKNRSGSFYELRQVKISEDPRKVHSLSEESKKLLLTNVIDSLAYNAKSKAEPVAFIITGQMGAGKSTVTNNIADSVGRIVW
jgi:signal recognition particle GTPase